jgi:spermidine/putrescine-binding protein
VSYTALYVLVMLLSFLLMNSWIVLARFIQQVKMPPTDKDFDALFDEKRSLEKNLDLKTAEIIELKARVDDLNQKISSLPPPVAS